MVVITPKFTLRSLLAFVPGLLVAIAAIAISVILSERPTRATETTRVTATMLNAQSALNTRSTMGAAYVPQCRETVIYVKWGAGTSAGVVTIESADDISYTGTWAPLATVTWSAASKEDIVQITGIHLNLATRISTAIVGGTVSTIMGCN